MSRKTKKITIPNKTTKLWNKLIKAIAPPPNLKISEWADRYRILSNESSAEPGLWKTERAPYQKEIMDCISSTKVDTVIVMSSSQVGKSEIENNIIGYYIDYDPAPMLLVQPTVDLAKDYSKTRIDTMIRDCPTINKKVNKLKSRSTENSLLYKSFPGGYLKLIGANAPGNLASKPIRVVLFDEVDRYTESAGVEGDPVTLAIKRTTTFWNRKIIMVSTPTIKGISRIEMEYESSTKEKWSIMCPECGEYQPYIWSNLKYKVDDEEIKVLGYVCSYCGCISRENDWKKQPGKWIAEFPKRKKRGFHLNEMTSPWKRWDEIVKDFIDAKKSNETLKAWVNTSLGETWEEYGDLDLDELLQKRRKTYNCEVPFEVVCLTCGVDVQDNRLEYEIVGWGTEKRSFGIKYGIILGDPGQQLVWDELDKEIFRKYKRADGLELQIQTTCIDSGGHFTTEVYNYCKKRESLKVWAIKGQGGSGVPYLKRPKKRNESGAYLFMIGVDVGKDTIVSRLKTVDEKANGYCFFPFENDRGYDEEYFEGLTSEKRITEYRQGRPVMKWVKKTSGARNEPFDIRNYATAALEILNPDLESLYNMLNKEDRKAINSEVTNQIKQKTASRRRYGVIKKGID